MKKLTALIVIGLSFFACTKNSQDPTVIQKPPSCKILKSVYYTNGIRSDSAEFIYSDNIVVRANDPKIKRYYTFEYQNGRLIKRNNFIEGQAAAAAYTNFTYEADGKLKTIEVSYPAGKDAAYEFTYTANKINKLRG